jgi:hypothetical protein
MRETPTQAVYPFFEAAVIGAVENGQLQTKREILERRLTTLLKPNAQRGDYARVPAGGRNVNVRISDRVWARGGPPTFGTRQALHLPC